MSKKKKKIKRRKKKIRVARLLIVLVLVIGLAAGMGSLYYRHASKAVNPNSKTSIVVDIPEGSTAKKIAQILIDKNLIRNKRVFLSNVKNTEKAEKIKAGKYKFSQNMSNDQIIDKLIKGQIYQDGIKVTVPEGSVSTEIVDLLVKKGLGQRKNFVNLFRHPENFVDKHAFLKNKRIVTLEGFLYPETYFFKKESSEKAIFDKMLSEFEKNYNSKVKASVEKNKLDFYDTVIMASIVEKEAVKDSERGKIAGVFYNRLNKKMRLQSDAVLQYALPKRKSRVMYKDLKIESPYNLYLNDGLPPTPVANPGIKSLLAAANPQKTEYLYFVTGTDGENYYSKTYEEHKLHADKYHMDLDRQEEKAKKEN